MNRADFRAQFRLIEDFSPFHTGLGFKESYFVSHVVLTKTILHAPNLLRTHISFFGFSHIITKAL